MDAQTILEIKPPLTTYRHEFDGCFANVGSQRHLASYVAGQLGDRPRKSIEPMADAAAEKGVGSLFWSSRERAGVFLCSSRRLSIGVSKKRLPTPFFRPASSGNLVGRWARPRTASSARIGATPSATFIRCWTASPTCPRKLGPTTARAAGRRASRTTWPTAPNGRWRWSNTAGPYATACVSRG